MKKKKKKKKKKKVTVAIQNHFNSNFAKWMVSLSEETWNLLKHILVTKKCEQ